MSRLAILVLIAFGFAETTQAQVRSVEVRTPRPFGYFVGDLVRAQIDVVVDESFSLQTASLPKPGPVAFWLDLRNVESDETRQGNAKRIRVNLTYQSFYAVLDARSMEIPGFALTVASDGSGGTTTAKADVPPWSINVSPLREVQPPKREDPVDYLRPVGRVAPLDAGPALRWAGGFALAALVALALLARDRAWGPFGTRENRAFSGVLRVVRNLSRRADEDAAYREALLALHRGLDVTDGRRVLADDLSAFLDRHPAFRGQAEALARFFAASRLAFFGRETSAAREQWPLAEAEAVARRLAAAERTA